MDCDGRHDIRVGFIFIVYISVDCLQCVQSLAYRDLYYNDSHLSLEFLSDAMFRVKGHSNAHARIYVTSIYIGAHALLAGK